MTEYHSFVDFVRDSKILEYGIAFVFMGAFAVFYRLMDKPEPQHAEAPATVVSRALDMVKGFLLPEGVAYHRGHTWARPEGAMATVGLDDFAAKLLGKVDNVRLPNIGDELKQGETAWTVVAGGKTIDMLAPVSGKVIAVNDTAAKLMVDDPYGAGWMVKVESPTLATSAKNLLSGLLARAWTEQSVDELFERANLPLGAVAADGGAPVPGMAKNIDNDKWDVIAKEFFLTD